jgi:hypothetical protein
VPRVDLYSIEERSDRVGEAAPSSFDDTLAFCLKALLLYW